MEYTAEKLYEMDVSSVTIIDKKNGEISYFFSVNLGLEDYLLRDHADDAAVYCYILNPDGTPRSDLELASIDVFLGCVNSGRELIFNEDRDITKFDIISL